MKGLILCAINPQESSKYYGNCLRGCVRDYTGDALEECKEKCKDQVGPTITTTTAPGESGVKTLRGSIPQLE
jgi:hypothetical protein